jgi:chromate transporter
MLSAILANAYLYVEFFKIGLFAVGGGLATLPFLYRLAGNYPLQTVSASEIPNMLAVAQMLPGAVGLNIAGYAGSHLGVPGAYIAVFGMITPQIIVIIIIARMYTKFSENIIVKAVFTGLRPAGCGLLAAAGFSVWKLALLNPNHAAASGGGASLADYLSGRAGIIKIRETLIFVTIFVLIRKFQLHPAVYIIAAAIVGITLGL